PPGPKPCWLTRWCCPCCPPRRTPCWRFRWSSLCCPPGRKPSAPIRWSSPCFPSPLRCPGCWRRCSWKSFRPKPRTLPRLPGPPPHWSGHHLRPCHCRRLRPCHCRRLRPCHCRRFRPCLLHRRPTRHRHQCSAHSSPLGCPGGESLRKHSCDLVLCPDRWSCPRPEPETCEPA